QELLYPILKYLNDEDFDFIKMDNAAIEDDEEEETRHHLTLDMLEEVDAGRSESLSDRFNYRYHSPETTRVVHKECVTEIKRKNDTQPDDAKVIRHTRQVNLIELNFKMHRFEVAIFETIISDVMMHVLIDWNAFSIFEEADSEAYIGRLIRKIQDRET